MEALRPIYDFVAENGDIFGTIACAYILIRAFKGKIPGDYRPLAAMVVCVAITVFNPLHDWSIALSVMYGGMMGGASIVAHVLAQTGLRLLLRKLLGNKAGDDELQRIMREAANQARDAHNSTRDLTPPSTTAALVKKVRDTLT